MKKIKFDRERLIAISDSIISHLSDLEKAIRTDADLDDRIRFNAAAMSIFQAINRSIDLADELIVECKLKTPLSYKESFEIIASENIVDSKISKKMSELIYFRNLISHEY